MLQIKQGDQKFNFRIAGILLHEGKVLLHREKHLNIWALPGGRGELMEHSTETIVREFKEEIGLEVQVDRLVWVAENFFTYKGVKIHELGFYYLLKCEQKNELFTKQRFSEIEGEKKRLVFEWFPLDQLPDTFYPPFLHKGLREIPDTLQHVTFVQEDQ